MSDRTGRALGSRRRTKWEGRKFSNLTIESVIRDSHGVVTRCICICGCGNKTNVAVAHLYYGHTKSCGCLKASFDGRPTHGLSKSPEYYTWNQMIQRCTNPKTESFPLYGGRGITVCDEWRTFERFYADMGPRPSPKHSIDRIDSDGPYAPNNCRWVLGKVQHRNRRNNRILKVGGVSCPVAEWAERTGIPASAIYGRIHIGWSDERAVTTPLRKW